MFIKTFTIFLLACLYSLYLAASPSSVFSQGSESKNQDSKICIIQQYINENTISSQENCVWEKIRSGIPADFNKDYGKLDPERPGHWTPDERRRRAISSKFLKGILLDETCQKEIPHTGVHIIGALFEEAGLNLENSELKHQLKLEESRFEGRVNFMGLISPYGISFKKSFFAEQFNLSWANIKGPLEMDNVEFAHKVKVIARPRGVWVQETPIEEKEAEWVFMRGLKVDSDIIMNDGDFFPVDLQLAKIGGRINLENSTFRQSDCPKSTDRPFNRPYCEESFLMAGSQISGEINMNQAKFLGKVSLRGAEVGNIVSMEEANFGKDLNMRGARLKSDFIMDNGTFQCVNLSLAKIEGQLNMENAEFLGESCIPDKKKRVALKKQKPIPIVLKMRDIEIESQLSMKGAKFHGIVKLPDASVGDQINMKNAEFYGNLLMYGLRANSRLTMENGQFRGKKVALKGANIRRDLSLKKAKFKGELNLRLAKIGSVTCDNTKIISLDLTGTQVDSVIIKIPSKKGLLLQGDLDQWLLQSFLDQWQLQGDLDQRELQGDLDQPELQRFLEQMQLQRFPDQLRSQGFAYKQFLIQVKNKPDITPDERETLYTNWLKKSKEYKPQPYEMAAEVMRQNGYPELATDLLYASKKEERLQAWETSKLRWAGLWVLQLTIGFGLGARLLLRPLSWLLLFILIGSLVCWANPIKELEPDGSRKSNLSLRDKMRKWLGWMAFSVDMILPLIRLREKHYDFDLQNDWQRYYFYIHQLFGWLMASFIFAGLAGLTQG